MYYRHFPLRNHAHARIAAIAAECAARQGRFDAYHALLFNKQPVPALFDWLALAREAGVADTAVFAGCLEREETAPPIEVDVADAQRLGLVGTPAVLVGRHLYVGALTMASLRAALDQADGPSPTR